MISSVKALLSVFLPPGSRRRYAILSLWNMFQGRKTYPLARISGRAWRHWLARQGEAVRIHSLPSSESGTASPLLDCSRLGTGSELYARLLEVAAPRVFLILDELVLEEAGLARMDELLAERKSFVYGDDDRLDTKGRRLHPRLRPHYSRILFENVWYLGELVACQRLQLLEFLEAGGAGLLSLPLREVIARFVLSLADWEIGHCAQIVAHLRPEASQNDWYLQRFAPPPLSPAPPDVTVIIPNQDQAGMLKRCLDSLKKWSGGHRYTILIAENGSRDPATFALYERLSRDPSVRILEWNAPFNYAAINNMAASASSSKLLLFLNNDVEARQAWLFPLAHYALRPDVGAVGAKLLYPTGRIQHAGLVLGMCGSAGHIFRFSPGKSDGYLGLLRFPRDAGAVTGACIMMRRDVFTRIGGFDESLAVTCNDVDLCLRVHAAGLRVVWTPGTGLIHHESLTRGQDDSPAKVARLLAEIEQLNTRWSQRMPEFEPLAHPLFEMGREDVCLK